MIPYFIVPPLRVGPLTLQPFGVLAAAGILLAGRIAQRESQRRGRPVAPLARFLGWAVAGGIFGGHLVHLFLYHPEELRTSWGTWQILKVWDGLSSTGGVLGGVVAAAIFFPVVGARFGDYADALALGIAPGWAVARLGCFTVHDHPGVLTDFFLAVDFPAGARHDLGLYDALVLFAFAGVLRAVSRRGALRDRLLPLLALLYGTSRFLLDFLRARDLAYVDARHFGLTAAQYAALLLVVYGLHNLARSAPMGGSCPRSLVAPPAANHSSTPDESQSTV